MTARRRGRAAGARRGARVPARPGARRGLLRPDPARGRARLRAQGLQGRPVGRGAHRVHPRAVLYAACPPHAHLMACLGVSFSSGWPALRLPPCRATCTPSSSARISPRRGVGLGRQVLDAVEHMHAHGFMHRDVKLANSSRATSSSSSPTSGRARRSGPAPSTARTCARAGTRRRRSARRTDYDERVDLGPSASSSCTSSPAARFPGKDEAEVLALIR